MAAMDRKVSQREKVKSISERVSEIEKSIPQLVQGVNGAFHQMQSTLTEQAELIAAISELLGEGALNAKVLERQARFEAERLAAAQKAVQDGLEKGTLVPATEISEGTLVVGKEVHKDEEGNVIREVALQARINDLKSEIKSQLLGKGVGTSVDVAKGLTIEVSAIYTMVAPEPPAKEKAAEPTPAPSEQ